MDYPRGGRGGRCRRSVRVRQQEIELKQLKHRIFRAEHRLTDNFGRRTLVTRFLDGYGGSAADKTVDAPLFLLTRRRNSHQRRSDRGASRRVLSDSGGSTAPGRRFGGVLCPP